MILVYLKNIGKPTKIAAAAHQFADARFEKFYANFIASSAARMTAFALFSDS